LNTLQTFQIADGPDRRWSIARRCPRSHTVPSANAARLRVESTQSHMPKGTVTKVIKSRILVCITAATSIASELNSL
jgi:hypothetical protein